MADHWELADGFLSTAVREKEKTGRAPFGMPFANEVDDRLHTIMPFPAKIHAPFPATFSLIEGSGDAMAAIAKMQDSFLDKAIHHNNRTLYGEHPKHIHPEKTPLNFSFPMQHKGMDDHQYYDFIKGTSYIYGRGTKREEKAVCGVGMIVTADCDLETQEEKIAMLHGCFDFISERYGPESILNNQVHFDEDGEIHVHAIIAPITKIDHDKIHYKIDRKKKTAVRTESGRYEYSYPFKLDTNGERIPVKNYDRMSDYYDKKFSANDVFCKAELQHLHQDMQQYLIDHGIKGRVIKGNTGGINFSVKELKEFTAETGKTINDVRRMQGDKTLLESFVEKNSLVQVSQQQLVEKEETIKSLQTKIESLQKELTKSKAQITELETKNKKLEQEVLHSEKEKSWGKDASWGQSSGWGNQTVTHESEEKLW